MKYVGMMRVRNEARWIERAIRSLLPLCEQVFIFDDHSTDATPEIANSFDESIVYESPFGTDKKDFSETRDKDYLLSKITASGIRPDYVICIDGDEELAPGGQEKIRGITKRGKLVSASFKILYLWNDPHLVRVDGIYRDNMRPSMFKYDTRSLTFKSLYTSGTSLHCTNVPSGHVAYTQQTDVSLLHWGYFDRDLRVKKYKFYNDIDPENALEDRYRHCVIGDLYPPNVHFLHGGPLQLEPLAL